MSTEDHVELVPRYGELIRGLQGLLDALRPGDSRQQSEFRSLKPEA